MIVNGAIDIAHFARCNASFIVIVVIIIFLFVVVLAGKHLFLYAAVDGVARWPGPMTIDKRRRSGNVVAVEGLRA